MIVQACLNGARPASFHPRLPHRDDDIVQDAIASVRSGANELHVHVYGAVDRESLNPVDVDRLLRRLRDALPGTLIGISSGDWIEADDERRLACIEGWTFLPDHASVNLSEPGAIEVIRALHRRGVGIEAGLSGPEDAERLIASGVAPLVLRLLVEVDVADVAGAMAAADRTFEVLAGMTSPKPILLHGFNATTWPLLQRAVAAGCSVRIGLEDTDCLPDGTVAGSNADLVRAAIAMRAEHQR